MFLHLDTETSARLLVSPAIYGQLFCVQSTGHNGFKIRNPSCQSGAMAVILWGEAGKAQIAASALARTRVRRAALERARVVIKLECSGELTAKYQKGRVKQASKRPFL
eukprot:364247-Chlamydomonas_euryale.AAC.10